jgi:hypothetical protein
MDRYEIDTFLTLAEELHFGRTAQRPGLSQGPGQPDRQGTRTAYRRATVRAEHA